jgi:hypothetical protein
METSSNIIVLHKNKFIIANSEWTKQVEVTSQW